MLSLIESAHIKGFRSLADGEIIGLPQAAVLIGANGSGKSNFIRFFEMLSWMLRSRHLGKFVERQGGADDQLFGGRKVSPLMDATVTMRTEVGRNDYRFTFAHAHPDRFLFTDEAFRFSREGYLTEADWQHLGSGHSEAKIVESAQASQSAGINQTTAPGARVTAVTFGSNRLPRRWLNCVRASTLSLRSWTSTDSAAKEAERSRNWRICLLNSCHGPEQAGRRRDSKLPEAFTRPPGGKENWVGEDSRRVPTIRRMGNATGSVRRHRRKRFMRERRNLV